MYEKHDSWFLEWLIARGKIYFSDLTLVNENAVISQSFSYRELIIALHKSVMKTRQVMHKHSYCLFFKSFFIYFYYYDNASKASPHNKHKFPLHLNTHLLKHLYIYMCCSGKGCSGKSVTLNTLSTFASLLLFLDPFTMLPPAESLSSPCHFPKVLLYVMFSTLVAFECLICSLPVRPWQGRADICCIWPLWNRSAVRGTESCSE